MAVENSGELQFCFFSQDSVLAKDFAISRNSDGHYPTLSLDQFVKHIKSDEKYERKIKREYNEGN